MPEVNLCSKLCQPLGRIGFRKIRTCYLVALIEENLGNTTHADAADSDEMNLCFLVFSHDCSLDIAVAKPKVSLNASVFQAEILKSFEMTSYRPTTLDQLRWNA
jgi:hypothetical protein